MHAARLPLLRLVQFAQAFSASGESDNAVRDLEMVLEVRGKDGVVCPKNVSEANGA